MSNFLSSAVVPSRMAVMILVAFFSMAMLSMRLIVSLLKACCIFCPPRRAVTMLRESFSIARANMVLILSPRVV